MGIPVTYVSVKKTILKIIGISTSGSQFVSVIASSAWLTTISINIYIYQYPITKHYFVKLIALRNFKVGHLSTLSLLPWSWSNPQISLVPRLQIDSIKLICLIRWGFQAWQQCSTVVQGFCKQSQHHPDYQCQTFDVHVSSPILD